MATEAQVEEALRIAVKERDGFCFKMTGYRGIPDRLILLPNGKAGFCEVKKQGIEPRLSQLAMHHSLRKRGYKVFVLDNVELVDTILEDIWSS